jgi:hypothetical protein
MSTTSLSARWTNTAAPSWPDVLALLVLTFLRGLEALRKSGFTSARMQTITEQMIALLPAQSPWYRQDTAK